ncbi:MAG: alpha/beta hydrolase [Acidimicrobiia bacterium]|nr:alpha/beta hydrolase [Acidimicrobiia bacterium]
MEITEKVIELADGRKLAFAEWGPPDAPPVMYFHGFPTNRQEVLFLTPALEQFAVNARLIVLNRPGFGSSSPQPGRSFLDWPVDVADAADQLKIDRFAVVGVSGGCPYALACGSILGERVTRIGIAVGVGPVEAPGMRDATAIDGPSRIGLIRRLQFGMTAYAFKKGQEDRFFEQTLSSMGGVDKDTMADPAARTWFLEMMRESLEQGGGPSAHEAGLYRKAWGFDLGEISTETLLQYGGADKTVPATAGRWLAEQLPLAHFTLMPEHGHFSWMPTEEAAKLVTAVIR